MSAPQRSASQRPSPPPAAARPEQTTGQYLTLVGLTPDGRRLRLADPHDPSGPEFTLEIDARLRAALGVAPGVRPENRPEKPVPKVETQMDSMLRPRDIQARIRAGETPEQVAAAAQTTVDKVMPYAAPVLAEREHVAERAQRSSIRRPAGDAPHGARTLGEAVTGHLHQRNVDPEVVAWDAWRREDGRWSLTGRFTIQGRDGLAELTFDQPGNFVVLDNDDARWLVGDVPDPVADPEPQLADQPGVRRLSSVPAEDEHQLSLTDELGEELGDDALRITDEPIEAFLDDQPGVDESELVDEAADAAALDDEDDETPEPPRRPVKKTRGRASVPSWDEIMFGGPSE
ncbi:septation protein SepH [Nocardioides halotolerans]|uniref:septation protein SepH n=1 Tax=Nocardioides halotolerans TaxID=433660 RepID=UPI000411D8E3|nr:septation protein SepH [Nocardioides halotolerans]